MYLQHGAAEQFEQEAKRDMAIPDTTPDTLDSTTDQGVPSEATSTTTREPVMNAFHPDYMKTFHPDFMKDFRTIAANQEERKINAPRKVIRKPRAVERAAKRVIQTKEQQRMTMVEVKAELLKPRQYYTYSKAGT